ncbi:hypothetical protein IVB41_09165 [Bradyrhizobium sp. 44]|uniref:hypothetical protein n=1 Tax=Bradyrhizobium sp. 44 TaxID=2782675 RepID=UPI001FF755B4|nr:hypothetical protein [Bradyrhizobium sp. 44]MCK1284103.1 hypothetical protein [Bradyrhizobium sp. 44]
MDDDTAPPILPARHLIQRQKFVGKDGDVTRLVWAYPVDGDAGLEWRNEIRIGGFADVCAVEHLISINSVDYTIIPAQVLLGSPGVIRRLCSEHDVRIGEMNLTAKSYELGTANVHDFVEFLQSPERRLPVVLVSPYVNGDPSPLDRNAMAQRLAGVAVVVHFKDPEATWDVADAVGRSMSCFDGAARLYWPGFSPDQDPRRHRLYLGARMRETGGPLIARSIERSIFAVAAFRFVPDPRLNDIVREAEQNERHQRLEVQKASSGIDWEDISIHLDEDLANATQKISDLESEIRNLKVNQQILFSERLEEPAEIDAAPEQVGAPTSVEEACTRAKDFMHLIVLDAAIDAARSSPYKRPADILEALISLDEIAAGGIGGNLLQKLKDRGWGKRSSMHISATTKANYGKYYQFEYAGKKHYFEPHITLGSGDANSCASIHFIGDHKVGKFVIGHVGRHLPNTNT